MVVHDSLCSSAIEGSLGDGGALVRKRLPVAAVLIGLIVGMVALPRSAEAIPTVQNIEYVVIAHPDDELSGWSLVQLSAGNFRVFILLTHGESTGNCNNYTANIDPGELPPPLIYGGSGSLSCEVDRLTPHLEVMAEHAVLDPTLSEMSPVAQLDGAAIRSLGSCSPRSSNFLYLLGELNAELIFDIGDGRVTQACVTWAVQVAREHIRGVLGYPATFGSIEHAVVGASYYNTSTTGGCKTYTHADHAAIYNTLRTTALGPPHQWTATCSSMQTGGEARTNTITDHVWIGNIEVAGAGVTSSTAPGVAVGNMQRHYGWLFPGNIDFGSLTGYDLNGGRGVVLQKTQYFSSR